MNDVPTTEEGWKAKLGPEVYHVLREKGTEAPGTGEYVHVNADGMFVCVGCGSVLFDSVNKFESGTGWPSFDRALPGAVVLHDDNAFGMKRTEVLCAKCGGHLGHVFDDGPKETTGKRFCINSCVLKMNKK
jgi:peptide-methionine (R)-S-oxide reductase